MLIPVLIVTRVKNQLHSLFVQWLESRFLMTRLESHWDTMLWRFGSCRFFYGMTRVTINDSRLKSESFLQNLQASVWPAKFVCTVTTIEITCHGHSIIACSCHAYIRGGNGSGLPESTPAGFCVLLSDRIWSQKFVKNRTRIRSHFHFGSSRSMCACSLLGKTWVNYGWIDDFSRSLNRSKILKFE